VEGERTARELTFGVAADSPGNSDLKAAKHILAVRHSCRGEPVTDENHAARSLGLQKQPHCCFFNMNAIRDKFTGHFGRGKNRADHTAIAMRKRAHSVVNVHSMMHSACNPCASLLV